MTLLPRWFQVGFLVFAALGILYVFVMYFSLETDLEDVHKIEASEISEIVLSPDRGSSIAVPSSVWTAVRPLLERSKRSFFNGWKGESWNYYCTLVIRTETSDFPFMLELKTRPSLNGKVIFSLSRGTKSSQWVYGSYKGNAILEYFRDAYPNTCES